MSRIVIGKGDFIIGLGKQNACIVLTPNNSSAKIGSRPKDFGKDKRITEESIVITCLNIDSIEVLEGQLKTLKKRLKTGYYKESIWYY